MNGENLPTTPENQPNTEWDKLEKEPFAGRRGHGESDAEKQLSPTVQRFIYGAVEKGGGNIGDRSQRKERWESYTDADSSECDYERFQYLVQDGVIGTGKAVEFLKATTERSEAINPEKAMEIMSRIDATDPEKGKTDTDVYHERKIIGYLLDGADGEHSTNDSNRWNNPDEVDNGAVFEIASKYPTPLDFRKDAIELIQAIWAGSENDSENEAKREEYRRAERDLEKNIYGEEQVEKANELMDALAEASALKHSGKVYFPRVRSHEEAKYCIVDQSGEIPHRRRQLFQYDSNLRLRSEYGNLA